MAVEKYLGRQGYSYGEVTCSPARFSWEAVRCLGPRTEKPWLFLTGQDTLLPGVSTMVEAALMTLRAVLNVTVWDFVTGNDILDRLF